MEASKLPRTMATINISNTFSKDYTFLGTPFQIFHTIQIYNPKDKKPFDKGEHGKAYLAIHNNSQDKVVVKCSAYINDYYQKRVIDGMFIIIDELSCIAKLQQIPHENIISFLFAGIDIEKKRVYEIMEYCDKGNMLEAELTCDEAIETCYQVAKGLAHLHAHNITHRDVKPNNIFMKTVNGKVIYKLANFELSCMKDVMKPSNIGARHCRAPEIYFNNKYTNKVDIWALGITLFYFLFNDVPYAGDNENEIEDKIKYKKFEYPAAAANKLLIHPYVKDLLEGMLQKDPEKRISAVEIIETIDRMRNKFPNLEIKDKTVLENTKQKEDKTIENSKFNFNQSFYPPYRFLDDPEHIVTLKITDKICCGGRGFVKALHSLGEYHYILDRQGAIYKINADDNEVLLKKKFDVGESSLYCSIILNKNESCLLLGGRNNKNIYAIDPGDLQTQYIWKNTYKHDLNKIIFLDNENFCAGYWDGLLKVFNLSDVAKQSFYNPSIYIHFLN